MLEQIGGECAGAVTFIPTGEKLPERNYSYANVDQWGSWQEILKNAAAAVPLMAGRRGASIRLSLAGAQDKIAVHIHDGQDFHCPLGRSTQHSLILNTGD